MIQKVLNNPSYRFLLIFLSLFTLLYYFNIFYLGIVSPGGYYFPFLAENLNYIEGFTQLLLQLTAFVLKLLGYKTFTFENWLHVSGKGGFILAYDCLGFGIMSFFTAFVIAYPKPIKSKYYYLPVGLLLIQSLNITRFVLLSLYWKGSLFNGLTDHHDLFNIVLYIMLLLIIYLWVNTKDKNHSKTHQHPDLSTS